MIRPTIMVVFDGARDEISIVTPVRPPPAYRRGRPMRARRRGSTRSSTELEAPARPRRPRAGRSVRCWRARRRRTRAKPSIKAHGRQGEGIHRRRRRLPDRAVAALHQPLRPAGRSRSTGRCGASIPRPISATSISAASRSSCRARRSWCGCATARSPSARSPARARAARRPSEDEALARELLADPKERAEHLMLLDLGRNDVGRVAKIGTVKVTDSFFIERYSHVMHIVSNVEGELRDGRRRGDGARRRLSRRHRLRRAESARDGDHRRTGEGQARHLRRLHRLFRRGRRNGHLHRAARLGREGRAHARPGRRRHRLRFLPRRRAEANASTRRGPCSAPPKRRCDSPCAESAGSKSPARDPAICAGNDRHRER